MRIDESLFLSFSLSLVYRRDLFVVVVGRDSLSCLNKQMRRKVLIRYDAIRCAEMQLPGGVDKSRQVLIDARE